MSSRNLYLGNIHPETQTHELRDIFKQYGELERCEVRFGGPTYTVAFGFVSYYSIVHAELAQRSEHGRIHRGRSLVVEFTKTTPGQNVSRNRRALSNGRSKNRNTDGRNRLTYSRHDSYSGFRRSRSSSGDRRSSRHRNTNNDRHRKRDRSRSPHDRRSNSKRYHSSPNNDRSRSSYSYKDRK
ncbi:unnamed protein product [Adineta steineri]|uniref:RRM domain-containing protein n=1 Tax=Adineta steineri TaxID=433720 RepID=A0A813QD93_9BILA|nr:unnamed protein product [Adineta steineri]CAF1030927.1 unnamed protein product [Adineta steineri]